MKKKWASLLLAVIMALSIVPMPKAGADVSGDDIVSTAMQYIGKVPYVWGGKTIDGNNPGADCGGFVCAIYDKCGISIWKHRGHLQNAGTNLGTDLDAALTGDIIWFPGHVAIYAGKDSNGTHMIVQETSDPYNNVCYTKASIVRGGVKGVIRVPGVSGSQVTRPAVAFSLPTDAAYTAKQMVSDTNAVLVNQIVKASDCYVTRMGMYLYNENNRLLGTALDTAPNVDFSTRKFHSWFDVNDELGITLTPGTTYQYQFFGVFNGTTEKSELFEFTTTGSAPAPEPEPTPDPTPDPDPAPTPDPTPQRYPCTVTFDACGGTVVPSNITVMQGSTYGTLPVPVRSGYEFEGWFTSPHAAALEYTADSTCLFGGNQTLYAHWKESANAILIFSASGGTVSPSTQTIPRNGTYSNLPTPVRSGYTFDGWFTVPQYAGDQFLASMRQIQNGDRYSLTGELNLYAHWSKASAAKPDHTQTDTTNNTQTTKQEEETVTLIFSAEGGVSGAQLQVVAKGKAIGSLPTAIKSGYRFLGWYTTVSGGKKVTSATVAEKNMALYAHWEKEKATDTNQNTTVSNQNTENQTDTNPPASGTNASKENLIYMALGSKYLNINGKWSLIDNYGTSSVVRNNRTLVPVRAVVEAMGGTVGWDAATQVVPLSMNGKTLFLQLNNSTSWDSAGKYYTLDTAPIAINNRTMLPIRFVVEYFGGEVNWDASTNKIEITY